MNTIIDLRIVRILVLITSLFLLTTCMSGCSMLTSPDGVTESWEETVKYEWGIAVQRLEAAGVPNWRLNTIQWHEFSWKPQNYEIDCGGVPAYGCFENDALNHPTITWWTDYPTVLRHEIGHGILRELKYQCWQDWEHKDKDGNPRNGGCPR